MTYSYHLVNPEHIRQTLDLLHPDGAVFEVCGIGTERSANAIDAGFFDDKDKAIAAAQKLTRDHHGVYVTLNPVDRSLLGRACNRIKPGVNRTADAEVVCNRVFLIDSDAERFKYISSSDAEHEAALQQCQTIKGELVQAGWPDPVVADSGNGGHLLYLLPDLPNDNETTELLKSCLAALGHKFDTKSVTVDGIVYNAGRLTKLYGTLARKGDSTPERPHRLSKILSLPKQWLPVDLQHLKGLSSVLPAAEQKPTPNPRQTATSIYNGPPFDLDAYLSKYGVAVKTVKGHKGSTLHVLETCLFDSSHSGGEAAIGQAPDGKLFYQCFHNSCKGKLWSDARSKISGDDKLVSTSIYERHHGSAENNSITLTEPPRPLQRELPPPEPFPIDALGEILGGAAKALYEGIQAPIALCAQSVLAAANLATQAHGDVVIDGRVFPTSSYFLTIGESGERKTAVDSEALRECRAYQSDQQRLYVRDLRVYENADLAYKKAREEGLKKAKGLSAKHEALEGLGDPPTPPLVPFLTAHEPTLEGLYRLLRDGRPSIGLFSDESGTFIGGHALNQDNRLKMAAGLSSLWDGKPFSRVRGGEGASQLLGRRICCHLMAQPRVAIEFLGDGLLIEQGLLSRFLVSYPESTAGKRPYSGLDLTVNPAMQAFHVRVREILAAPMPVSEEDHQELTPRHLVLSRQAHALWVKFHDLVEEQLADDQPLAPIRGFANKAPEHALRLAGTLALFNDLRAQTIDLDHILDGVDLAKYYLGEALRLFHAGTIDPKLKLAAKLLTWAQQYEFIHARQIYRLGPNQIRDAATAKEMAAILENHGWLIPIVKGMELDGAFRQAVWMVVKCSEN